MKKYLFLTALCLTAFSSVARAQLNYGVCMAQDEQNLYISSPEFDSFVVMDKETGRMQFLNEENGGLDLGLNPRWCTGITVSDGKVLAMYAPSQLFQYEDGTMNEIASYGDDFYVDLFQKASDGSYWGTDGYTKFFRFDRSLSYTAYDYSRNPYSMEYSKGMAVNRKGEMWAVGNYSTSGKSSIVCLKDGKFTSFPEAVKEGVMKAIAFDNNDLLWYASYISETKTYFVGTFDGTTFSGSEVPSDILPHGVSCMKFDSDNRLWLTSQLAGTVGCLADGRYTTYELPTLEHSTKINDIVTDGDVVYILGATIVYMVNPSTGIADGYGGKHMRPVLYTIKDGKVKMTEIVPSAGDTNAVSHVEAAEAAPAAMYDLQGRRLTEEPAKGVYIQNGKKVVK